MLRLFNLIQNSDHLLELFLGTKRRQNRRLPSLTIQLTILFQTLGPTMLTLQGTLKVLKTPKVNLNTSGMCLHQHRQWLVHRHHMFQHGNSRDHTWVKMQMLKTPASVSRRLKRKPKELKYLLHLLSGIHKKTSDNKILAQIKMLFNL